MNISDLVIGGMLMLAGTLGYLVQRTQPDALRGVTYKQFVFSCVVAIIGGAVLVLWQFLF